MKSKKLWIPLIIILILLGAGYFFRDDIIQQAQNLRRGDTAAQVKTGGSGRPGTAVQAGNFTPGNLSGGGDGAAALANAPTTTIRPASDSNQVSAAGNIEVAEQVLAASPVDGVVAEVKVDVGDVVSAGDILVSLDTSDLEWAVAEAELSLASAQAQLDQLLESADDSDIAAAQASLASTQENLADVQDGPGDTELAAAEANLTAAQQKYQDLLDDPSEAELTQLSASLEKAFITLEQAQGNYDEIAYGDSVGASPQAIQLQQATIDYESAKAAYEIAIEPASDAELAAALSSIESARDQLETLKSKPTDAELAVAMSQVVNAEATLEKLLRDPGDAELRSAEISVSQAELKLEQAREDLASASLAAPIAATVLAMNVEVGQKIAPGFTALTLANLNDLEISVNVAEVDISKIYMGQQATVTIDALPGENFGGVVTRIAPSSSSEQGVVNYPVTIRLSDSSLAGVRPGMTAVAAILDDSLDGGWLVPTEAIRERGGNTIVIVIQDGQPNPVTVEPGAIQGEWTVVKSDKLQAGDEVVGSVSSFINQDDTGGGFGPGRPPGGGFGGGRQ